MASMYAVHEGTGNVYANPSANVANTAASGAATMPPAERYQRLVKLGEGTYGAVYHCRDRLMQRDVAIKVAKPGDNSPGIPAVTVREISLLRELRHPGIVRLHDIYLQNLRPNLVFEYMHQDLRVLIERRLTPILGEKLKSIIFQLAAALNACHARRVVHRDLKPMNILVSRDETVVKLADFGMGRAFCLPLQTYTGALMTPLYRAPEMMLGDTHYLPAVDIWSLGCTMAELATKRPLFVVPEPPDTADKARAVEVPQMMLTFSILGTPNETVWPGVSQLPYYSPEFCQFRPRPLSERVPTLDPVGLDLLSAMLTYCPERRITAAQILMHPWFDDVRDRFEEALRVRAAQEQRELAAERQFSSM